MNGEERQIRLITYKISKIYHVWLELANAPSNFWLGLKSASSADNYLSVSFAALITEFSKHQSEFDCILHLETSIFSPPLKALICIRILMVHTSSLNWVSCCSSKLKKVVRLYDHGGLIICIFGIRRVCHYSNTDQIIRDDLNQR